MRKIVLPLIVAASLLGGCTPTLKYLWDELADSDCEQSSNPEGCRDRVEEIQRERDRR